MVDRRTPAVRRRASARAGTVALEFALVSVALLGMIVFIVALGFRLYAQSALDYATAHAARQLAVDATQSLSHNATAFQSVTFCPALSPLLPCAQVAVALQPVTDFRAAASIAPPTSGAPATFNPGQGGALMLLQTSLVLPVIPWPANMKGDAVGAGTFGRASGGVVRASYPFQNEY